MQAVSTGPTVFEDLTPKQKVSTTTVMSRAEQRTTTFLSRKGRKWSRVGWFDAGRSKCSSLGNNISDWSFRLKDGTVLPFVQYSTNYKDTTATMRAKDLAVVVGNETASSNLKSVTMQKYLENYGKYTPGVPNDVDLSASRNDHVTIRSICVVVPENEKGFQEV
jgi:hypothetical protein